MTQSKMWRKAKVMAIEKHSTPFNAGSAMQAAKPATALTPNMRKGVVAQHEKYVKRERGENEALPITHAGKGTYRPGDGEALVVYRPGAFDHMQYKSLGIGA